MGKLLSLLFAVAALAMLALVAFSRQSTVLGDIGLVVSFVFFSALALGASLITALRRMIRSERGWHAVFWLLIFCWLPALPPLLYGLSGVGGLGARSRRRAAQRRARTMHLGADAAREVAASRPRREPVSEPVSAGDRSKA
jgi:hypothetical protein